MIRSHGFQLMEATGITPPGRLVQGNGSGLYAPYEKKHFMPT
jgi:hypothetical protein